MDRPKQVSLTLIGTSISQGNMQLFEKLTLAPENRPRLLPELKAKLGVEELNYLATCNRVELATSSEHQLSVNLIRNRILDFFLSGGRDFEFSPKDLYQFSGAEAVRHLFRVASSLESMVVGETQITGQFKDAYQECANLGLVANRLGPLLQHALHTSRRVRKETEIGIGSLSMATLVINTLEKSGHLASGTRVALIGSGEMTLKMAAYFRARGVHNLVFVNRTTEKARQLASKFAAKAISLEEFISNPDSVDVIISSTSAPFPVFNSDFLKRLQQRNEKITCVDLAIPRDFSNEFGTADRISYIDILELQRRKNDNLRKRFKETDMASYIIEQEVRNYLKSQFENDLQPILRESVEKSLQYGLEQCEIVFSSPLNGHSPGSMRAMQSLIRRVVGFSSAQLTLAVSSYLTQQLEMTKTLEKNEISTEKTSDDRKTDILLRTFNA